MEDFSETFNFFFREKSFMFFHLSCYKQQDDWHFLVTLVSLVPPEDLTSFRLYKHIDRKKIFSGC